MNSKYSSPALANGMARLYGNNVAKTLEIKIQHKREIRKYLKATEDAYRKAAKSKLRIGK